MNRRRAALILLGLVVAGAGFVAWANVLVKAKGAKLDGKE